MSGERTFEVKALTRVEGEGRLYVRINDQTVEHVELNIYEPPRFFESFLIGRQIHEVPDITARICGICPVAYQMSSCHALEKALGLTISPEIRLLRRLLYCGEWIESHCLHIHLLHAPDFLGYESGLSMAADHREFVTNGLRMKKIGNDLLKVLGGRPIHPVNVTVGGFYRAPRVKDVKALLPELEWAFEAAQKAVETVCRFDFPEFDQPYEFVSLQHSDEFPMNEGQVVASDGLAIPVAEYESHFEEIHVPQSTALHSVRLPNRTPYLCGPLARMGLCLDQLPPTARKLADECDISWPTRNNFHSIVARAIEVVVAFEEAISIVRSYNSAFTPSRIPYEPGPGEGQHATEAPRGLLYHRYRIGDDGRIAEAKIVPPTSQNQWQVEEDLKAFVPQVLHLDDQAATHRCEQLIRNYDPCISCATHFLKLKIDRST